MWTCNECSKTFKDETRLDQHQASTGHILILACPVCSKAFPDEGRLDQHQTSRGHRGMWTCKECSKQYGAEVNLDKHQMSKAHVGKIDVFGREKCEMCEKSYDHENNMIAHQNDEGHSNDPVAVRYWEDYKIESEENGALKDDLIKVKNSLQECQPFVQLAQITNHLGDVLIWDASHQNGVISRQYYRLVRLQAVRDIKSSELLWRLECYVNKKINSRKGYIIAKIVTEFL